jgi:hypothetical protein
MLLLHGKEASADYGAAFGARLSYSRAVMVWNGAFQLAR